MRYSSTIKIISEGRIDDEMFGSILKFYKTQVAENKPFVAKIDDITRLVAVMKQLPRRDQKVWTARAGRYLFANDAITNGATGDEEILLQKILVDYNRRHPEENKMTFDAFMHIMETNIIGHFLTLDFHKVAEYRFEDQSVAQMMADVRQIDTDYKNYATSFVEAQKGDKVIMTFPDGLVWMLLARGYCQDEADAMGHCGNRGAGVGEKIISLRKPKLLADGSTRYQPCLTFILHPDGHLGEMKGRGNEKPAAHYHDQIVALLRSKFIKGIRGGGYLPQNNFDLTDLPIEQQNDLADEKPALEQGIYTLKAKDRPFLDEGEGMAWFNLTDGQYPVDLESLGASNRYTRYVHTYTYYSLRVGRVKRDGKKVYRTLMIVVVNEGEKKIHEIMSKGTRNNIPKQYAKPIVDLMITKDISLSPYTGYDDSQNYLDLGKEQLDHLLSAKPDIVSPDNFPAYVRNWDDFMTVPQSNRDEQDFLYSMIKRVAAGRRIENEDCIKILDYYTKINPDPAYWEPLCEQFQGLLILLPERFQTNEAKLKAAESLHSYQNYEKLIPKPWPKEIEDDYWKAICDQNSNLLARNIPVDQQTDYNLTCSLANNPEDIPLFLDRLTPEMVNNGLTRIINSPTASFNFITALPERLRTKELQKIIYEKARDLKNKSDEQNRDEYLEILTLFHHDLWPWKASKLSNRLAMVNPDFNANPEQFRTPYFAALWIDEHPTKLSELDEAYVTPKVVEAALKNTISSPHLIEKILAPCNPEIVKPEWVAPALSQIKDADLEKVWKSIPDKYLNEEVLTKLAEKGSLPLDDPRYPKSALTPKNIVARWNTSVPYATAQHVEKKDTDGKVVSSGPELVNNISGMKAAWDALPPSVDKKTVLIALITSKGGFSQQLSRHGFSTYGGAQGFEPLVTVVDKSLLDSDVLTAWIEHQKNYAPGSKEIFSAFPESAYTPQNMAMAVSKHIISEVPKHLQDDDVLVNMMKDWSSTKNVDWSIITPEIFMKLIKKKANTATHNMQFNIPADSPLMFNVDIARELLKKERGEGRFSSSATDDKTLNKIYGEHPERTKNWTQDCFDLAAGNIVPFRHIPEQFHSDKVIERALKTDPHNSMDIPEVAKWLNKNQDKLPPATVLRMAGNGVAYTPSGWIDFNGKKHTTVEGAPGSYVVTDLKPSGKALLIFDDDNKCVDALAGGTNVKPGQYQSNVDMFASNHARVSNGYSSETHDKRAVLKSLAKYRLLIADAVDKNSDLMAVLPAGYSSHGELGTEALADMTLFKKGDKLIPVEKLPRQHLIGSNLTYVQPQSGSASKWNGGTRFFMFNDQGPSVGIIQLVEGNGGRGMTLMAASIKSKKMADLLGLSKGFATFLRDQDVTSGNNPTFKESPLYTKLGMRGPGKNEWYSLLNEKLAEDGHLSVWRYGQRITIAHDELGVLASAKKVKGGWTREFTAEGSEDFADDVQKLYDAIEPKL